MLDSEHENPELIWNNDTSQRVARVVAEECNKLYQKQKVGFLESIIKGMI